MNIKQIAIDCGMVIRSVLYGDGVFNTITCTDKDLEAFAKAILASEQEPVGIVTGLSIANNPREFEWYKPVELGTKLYLHPSQDKDRIAKLELENKTLREAFKTHSRHLTDCNFLRKWIDSDCNCGLFKILSTPTSTEQKDKP